jgi:oxidoreductase
MRERLPGIRAVDSVEDACQGAHAVLIASPNPLHMEQCLASLAAGKMVLCEKPVVLRPEHFQQLSRHSTSHAFVVPAAVCRHRADVQLWLERCKRAGRARRLSLSWMRGRGVPGSPGSWHTQPSDGWTGVLPDLGYHLLDLALFTLGCEVGRVRVERLIHRTTSRPAWAAWYAHSGHTHLEVPDDFHADLDIDGVRVSIRVCWSSHQAGDTTRFEFEGECGTAMLNTLLGFSNEALESVHYVELTDAAADTEHFEFKRGPETHIDAFRGVLDAFAAACLHGPDAAELSRMRSVATVMELLDAGNAVQ